MFGLMETINEHTDSNGIKELKIEQNIYWASNLVIFFR